MKTPLVVSNQSIDEVLRQLRWRTEPSVIEGRRRLYDSEGMLQNVCSDEEAFELLEEAGIIVRAKETV